MEKYYPYAIVTASCLSRLIPHVSNFSPVYGSVNYSFVTIKNSLIATITFAMMLYISDLLLHLFFNKAGAQEIYPLFGWWIVYVYPSHLVNGFLSKYIVKKPNQYVNIGVACTITSFSFFMLSNFGKFLFTESDHSMRNLRLVFLKAIPFFPMTILANITFTYFFFIIHSLLFNRRQTTQTHSLLNESDSLKIQINPSNPLLKE